MKKLLMIIFASAALFGIGRYIHYGSLVRTCAYTEENVVIPPELAAGQIITTKKSYRIEGVDSEYACLPVLGNVKGMFSGSRNYEAYYTRKGLHYKEVPKEEEFKIVRILRVTKHGIATIDSGSGPLYFLILADKQGGLLKLATVSTGVNEKDRFLKYTLSGNSFMLSPEKLYALLGVYSYR